MLYSNLHLPTKTDRPFFYTSFVTTVDGKVQIDRNGYWPIGSKTDYDVFTFLRAGADAIVDGKNTALRFGKHAIDTIHSEKFRQNRQHFGKSQTPEYIVVTSKETDELNQKLKNKHNHKPTIFTEGVDELVKYLSNKKYKHVFIDGGPTLLGSFFEKMLIDEVFLTIAPKIFGNKDTAAITMVEGFLFPPNEVPKLNLLYSKIVENEVFLRYSINY